MNGWVKIYRSMLYWEWADVPEMVALWVRLLIMATHEEQQWHGKTINRGQLVTTYLYLSEETGITMQQLRTCFDRLKKSGQITIETTNKYSIITICKYDSYQDIEEAEQQTNNTLSTHYQHTSNTPATSEQHINKNDKNIRTQEEENIINNPPTPLKGGAPKPTVSKMEKTTPHAVTRYDRVWEEIFQKLTNDTFAWAKRENVAVQSIVGKIVKMMQDKGKEPTDDEKEAAFRWFLESLYATGDEWIVKNFTPHVICDKFNEYYQTIKLQTNGTRKPNHNPAGVSADYAARVASELIS